MFSSIGKKKSVLRHTASSGALSPFFLTTIMIPSLDFAFLCVLAATYALEKKNNKKKKEESNFPPQADPTMPAPTHLARDVQFLWQNLRIVLVGCTALNSTYEQLTRDHNLKEFAAQAIPIILNICAVALGDAWGSPRLSPIVAEAREILQGRLAQTMSQDTAVALAAWIVGDRPPAVVMGEHFVPANIIGIYRQGGNTSNYLLRLRHTHGGLLVAHMMTQVIGQKLRQDQSQIRFFPDRVSDGKGPAKGRGKGKAKGRGRGEDRGRGRGRAARERSPRGLRQVPPEGADPPPVAPAAADPAAALARGQEQPEA